MDTNISLEWVDKYCPQTLEDYVLDPEIKAYFKNMIQSKNLQSFSMVGCAGQGKTTLAKLLCNELNAEVLFVKCATQGTVDIVRSKIEPFCNAMSIEGKIKVVILDELDSSSSGGTNSFQMALRTLIEAAQSDTRFICTFNFANKVIPALLSRCPIIPLKYKPAELLVHLKKILDTEKIKYDKASLKAFLEDSFKFYPDCRRIIKYLQLCSNSGELVVKLNAAVNSEKNELVKELINRVISASSKIMDIRSFYLANKTKIDDYKIFAGEIFDYVLDNNIISSGNVILKMSDIIYQMNLVVNPEIQFFALICLIYESVER